MTRPGLDGGPLPLRRAPDWVDPVLGVLAAVLAVVVAVTADLAAIDPDLRPASPASVALTAVGALGIGWRRRRPAVGLAMVATAALLVSATGAHTGLLPYLTMLALYALAVAGPRRAAVGGLVLVLATFLGLHLAGVPDLTFGDVLTSGAVCVAATAVGDAVRQRRANQVDLLAAAEERAVVGAQRAVAEERLRIAQELHDVVAHSMSLIAVQAGVGAHLIRRDPDAAENALAVIAETSRAALTQTRSVVGLLRSGEDAQSSVPGLVSLHAMVQGVRGAGMTVDVHVDGPERELSAPVDLAAYRVVQEALTNAVKHAPGDPVTVRVTYRPAELLVDVSSAGGARPPADSSAAPGFGLVGLHERVRAVGGRLRSGPTPDGGFCVAARIPTAGARP